MKRFILFLQVVAAALALRPVVQQAQPTTAPSLILLLADDQRWDALGVAGNSIIQTPNIDQLARDGFYFRRSYVTTPVSA